MVRHIVSWNFKPELTPQARRPLASEGSGEAHRLKGKSRAEGHQRLLSPHGQQQLWTWSSIPRWEQESDLPCIRTTGAPGHSA